MDGTWRAVAQTFGVVLGVTLASAGCGDDSTPTGADRETTDFLHDVAGFDVAASDGSGWLLSVRDRTEVWAIEPDGTLTRHAELPEHAGEIRAFGDGVAVGSFRCTDDDDTDCGGPVAKLFLVAADGSVEEVTLSRSDAGGLEGVGMSLLGSSEEHLWVEVRTDEDVLFQVSESGDVETIPFERRAFTMWDQLCVLGGELTMLRVHDDLLNSPQGLPATGVELSPATRVRTTVSLESFVDGAWRPVPGSERVFEILGDTAITSCEDSSVEVAGRPATAGQQRDPQQLASWTPGDGWRELPPGPEPPPPAGSVSIGRGCDTCVWGPDGRILGRGPDLGFEPTGVVLAEPGGGGDPPIDTVVEISHHGAVAACAQFPSDAPTTTLPPPSTVTVTAVTPPRWRADATRSPAPRAQKSDAPLVCDATLP